MNFSSILVVVCVICILAFLSSSITRVDCGYALVQSGGLCPMSPAHPFVGAFLADVTETCANVTGEGLGYNGYTISCSGNTATITHFQDAFCHVAVQTSDSPVTYTLGSCNSATENTVWSCDANNFFNGNYPPMVYAFSDKACQVNGYATAIVASGNACLGVNSSSSYLVTCASSTSVVVGHYAAANCDTAQPISSNMYAAAQCFPDPTLPTQHLLVDCGKGLAIQQGATTSSASQAEAISGVSLLSNVLLLLFLLSTSLAFFKV